MNNIEERMEKAWNEIPTILRYKIDKESFCYGFVDGADAILKEWKAHLK